MTRANPFGDLDDFTRQDTPKPVPAAAIEELAETSGFPSRKAQRQSTASDAEVTPSSAIVQKPRRRRRTTGRSHQINIKATEETITELYRVADELDLPLGAVLEQALAALVAMKR